MKKIKRIMLVSLCLHAFSAHADSQLAKVVGFLPYTAAGKEVLLFKLQANNYGGCNASGRYAIDSSSPHFKATYAAILSSFHAQNDVFVAYSQSCNSWSNAWDVAYVCVGSINC